MNIVGISSTKCRGSKTAELDEAASTSIPALSQQNLLHKYPCGVDTCSGVSIQSGAHATLKCAPFLKD